MKFSSTSKLKTGEIRERWGFYSERLDNYNACSSGEKRRIDIAVLLGLNAILRSRVGGINLLVFDETLDTLDKSGIEGLFELIKGLNIPSIFLVSHSDDLKQEFDFNNYWTVERKGNISVLK